MKTIQLATQNESDEALLRLSDVIAMHKKIMSDERLVAEASERLELNRQEFDIMLRFVPDWLRTKVLAGDTEQPLGHTPEPHTAVLSHSLGRDRPRLRQLRVNGFASKILTMLQRASIGMSHTELMDALLSTEFRERVTTNAGKGYYNTVGKLIAVKKVIKHGSRLYSPQMFNELEALDALPPADDMQVRRSSSGRIALDVLEANPNGLTGQQIKEAISLVPGAPASVAKHGQYIYNILGTLVGAGRVVKEGNIFRLAQKATPRGNGASGTHASGPAR